MIKYLTNSKSVLLFLATFTSLLACGGREIDLVSIEVSAGGSAGVASATTGGAGTLATGGALATGGYQESGGFAPQADSGGNTSNAGDAGSCVVRDLNILSTDGCAELARLVVRDPKVTVPTPSNRVMPGDTVSLSVTLSDLSGFGYNMYPGVVFESSVAGVVIDPGGPGVFLYALLACQSIDVSSSVRIPDNVAPGTVVNVTARVTSLNTDCLNGPAIVIPITVG